MILQDGYLVGLLVHCLWRKGDACLSLWGQQFVQCQFQDFFFNLLSMREQRSRAKGCQFLPYNKIFLALQVPLEYAL